MADQQFTKKGEVRMKKKNVFKFGDVVKWSSQSAGRWKEKKGVVVSVLYRDDVLLYPDEIAAKAFPGHKRMFGGGWLHQGEDLGYFVEVASTGRGKPLLYYPYASRLSLAEEKITVQTIQEAPDKKPHSECEGTAIEILCPECGRPMIAADCALVVQVSPQKEVLMECPFCNISYPVKFNFGPSCEG